MKNAYHAQTEAVCFEFTIQIIFWRNQKAIMTGFVFAGIRQAENGSDTAGRAIHAIDAKQESSAFVRKSGFAVSIDLGQNFF